MIAAHDFGQKLPVKTSHAGRQTALDPARSANSFLEPTGRSDPKKKAAQHIRAGGSISAKKRLLQLFFAFKNARTISACFSVWPLS